MPDPETSTLLLLQRWHTGDEGAFEQLLRLHLPSIRAHVHRRLGPLLRQTGDTGDFVQDAVVDVLRYAPRFVVADGEHFRQLLGRIVENVLRDGHERFTARCRQLSRERPLPSDSVLALDPSLQSQTSPSEAAARHEQEAWVRLGLHLLDPEDRDLLVMRAWDDLPFAEVAARLHTSEGAARMRHQRALERLAEKVGALRRGNIGGALDPAPAS